MFAGEAAAGRHITSNNVRNMQLFHELKQKFPTVPDQVVSSCIAAYNANPATTSLNDLLLLHQEQQQQQQQSREQSLERTLSTPNNNSENHGDHMGGRNTITAPPVEVPCPTPLHIPRLSDIDDNVDNVSPDTADLFEFGLVVVDSATCDKIASGTPHEVHTNNEMHATNIPHFSRQSSEQVKAVPTSPQSQCDTNGGETETKPGTFRRFIKHQRPNNLAVKSIHQEGATSKRAGNAGLNKIQPSERYNDLHTLLNSNDTATATHKKPPRSPITGKHPPPILGPKPGRPQTVASQTTDTLLIPPHSPTSNVNLSLNVLVSPSNELCSIQQPPTPPPKPRHTTNLNVVPEPTWIQPPQSGQSGRSYTSVNLTLRSPTTEPQAPIDITSQNSTLTYSTSSFDRARGLQSRLEISVGPGGQSTVSSVRRQRPKSSYHPVLNGLCEDGVGNSVVGGSPDGVENGLPAASTTGANMVAAGSLPNLAADGKATTVILEQQVRINRLRIELRTEKTRLVAMQREVTDLEAIKAAADRVTTTATTTTTAMRVATTTTSPKPVTTDHKTEDIEVERRLQREINHLRGQCEQLADAVDQKAELGVPLGETSREFYQNIYTGQQGSISVTSSATADYTARRIATVTSQGSPGTTGTPPITITTASPTAPGRPPRPPMPYPFHRPQQSNNSQVHPAQLQDETEDQSCWNCSVCTFQNHPLLNKCEQCEMLRGNTPSRSTSTPQAHNIPPPPYSPHPPSPATPTTPNSARARSNQHSLTPPRSWLSSNNPNNATTPTAVTPGGSSGSSSASTPGSTNKGYPVQQYQVLPPGYIPSPYGGPPTALPWIFPTNPMPVNTNPAVYNMQNSSYYVANSDGYGRRSSEGSGALRPAPPIPGQQPQPPPRSGQHNRSLSQPDSRSGASRRGTAHR